MPNLSSSSSGNTPSSMSIDSRFSPMSIDSRLSPMSIDTVNSINSNDILSTVSSSVGESVNQHPEFHRLKENISDIVETCLGRNLPDSWSVQELLEATIFQDLDAQDVNLLFDIYNDFIQFGAKSHWFPAVSDFVDLILYFV